MDKKNIPILMIWDEINKLFEEYQTAVHERRHGTYHYRHGHGQLSSRHSTYHGTYHYLNGTYH